MLKRKGCRWILIVVAIIVVAIIAAILGSGDKEAATTPVPSVAEVATTPVPSVAEVATTPVPSVAEVATDTPSRVGATQTSTAELAEASASTETPEPTAAPVPADTPDQPKAAELGDVVQASGAFISALQVEDPAPPGMFYKEEEGKKLVAIELVVGNLSGDALSVNPLYATLVDGDGFSYSLELAAKDDQLPTVSLARGEKVRGWVAFEIPDESTVRTLKYQLGTFSGAVLQTGLGDQTETPARTAAEMGDLPPGGNIGETTEAYGYSLVAVTFEDPALPGVLYKAKEGSKLVAVEIVVGNVSGDTLTSNPLYASLVDTHGFVYTPELAGRDGQLDVLDLNQGEKVRGWVAFEIPPEATPHSVKYDLEMFSGKQLRAGLGVAVGEETPPVATPEGVAKAPFVSGGLGLSKDRWEEAHVESGAELGFTEYDDGQFSVLFADNRIQHLQRAFGTDEQPTLDDARQFTAGLIPEDAQFLETYSPEGLSELTVDLYMSESLKEQIEPTWFIGGEPGQFIAVYGVFDGRVPRIVIATGNNP